MVDLDNIINQAQNNLSSQQDEEVNQPMQPVGTGDYDLDSIINQARTNMSGANTTGLSPGIPTPAQYAAMYPSYGAGTIPVSTADFASTLETPNENAFLTILDWLAVPARLQVQTNAAIERTLNNFSQGQFRVEMPQYDVNDITPADAEQSINYLQRVGPGFLFTLFEGTRNFGEELNAASPFTNVFGAVSDIGEKLPESPEQAASILGAVAQAVEPDTFMGRVAKVLPWMSGIVNREFLAEAVQDPLNLLDAAGVGTKLWNSARRTIDAVGALEPVARTIAPLRNAANRVAGSWTSQVHRAARPFIQAGRGERAELLRTLENARQTVLGAAQPGDAPEFLATFGRAFEEAPEVARDVTLPLAQQQRNMAEWFETSLPDVPQQVRQLLAYHAVELSRGFDKARAWELLNDIPTPQLLDDLQYVPHILSSEARQALNKSIGLRKEFDPDIGAAITQSLRGRNIEETIDTMNKLSADGLVGWLDGKLKILNAGEAVPEHWVPVTGKLFQDDPFMLSFIRRSKTVNAVNAVQFLKHVTREGSEFLAEEGSRTGYTLQEAISKNSWRNTFGKLAATDEARGIVGNPIRDMVDKAVFVNKETAQAVARYTNLTRNFQEKPWAVLRHYDRILGTLRAWTLSPFLPYHARNFVGNIVNNDLAGVTIFDYVDAALHQSRRTDLYKEAEQMGNFYRGEIAENLDTINDMAHLAPVDATPVRSWWSYIDPADRRSWGARLGTAIENNARMAHYVAKRQRYGMNAEQALDSVNKFLFDYTDIPPWQRNVGKRIFFFPTWTFKNIPLQAEFLIKTPSKFAMRGRIIQKTMEAAGQPSVLTRDFIAEGGGFPLPSEEGEAAFFRPENFDPAFSLGEIFPQGDEKGIKGITQAAWRFAYGLLNPFFTEPIEQASQSIRVGSYGGPFSYEPAGPMSKAPEARETGFDYFFNRPIERTGMVWNPLVINAAQAVGIELDPEMPDWAKRGDHAMRSFFRIYNEFSNVVREFQKGDGISGEFAVRKMLGVPVFIQDENQLIHFGLRELDRGINAMIEAPEGDFNEGQMKQMLMERLALLGLGSFAEIDPFSGEPRSFLDVPADERTVDTSFTLSGKKEFYQEAERTCWRLLVGGPSPSAMPDFQPLNLSQSEQDFVEGLLARIIDTYIIEANNAFGAGEISERSYESLVRNAQERMGALEEIE